MASHPITRAAHERTDAHARYSHGFLALWRPTCRGQHRSGLPPSFFFPSVTLLFPNTTRFPPRVRTTSTACVGTHMSRIPTVPRHRRHLVGESREKTKDAHPPPPTEPNATPYTALLHRERRTKAGHVHSRARAPFCRAFSRGRLAFQNSPLSPLG